MAIRDLLRSTFVSSSLSPAARTNGTATGTSVDLINFDGAVFAVSFGSWTDGTHTPSVVESTDGTIFTAAPAADLDGTFAAVSGTSGANTVQQVGYIGSNRFVAVVMTTTGATSGAVSQASVVGGYPHNAPTQ